MRISRRPVFRAAIAVCLAAVPFSSAPACDLATAPTSRWSVVGDHGVQWLKTPCGDRFYSLGVNTLDGGYDWREKDNKIWYSWKAFNPTIEDWVRRTEQRVTDWGFNTAGGWSLTPDKLNMPMIVNLELGRRARFHWFDPFDPETEDRMMELAREFVARKIEREGCLQPRRRAKFRTDFARVLCDGGHGVCRRLQRITT